MSGDLTASAQDPKAILSGLRGSERMRRKADRERLRWLREAKTCPDVTMTEATEALGLTRTRAYQLLWEAAARD